MLREGSKNAISISEKGLFDCKKICINNVRSMYSFPSVFIMAFPRICRYTWICTDNDFFNFHAFAICIFKRNAISKSLNFIMCFTIFTKNIVLSKYIFCILIYLACCLIFGIETLIFPQLRSIGYKVPILLFMVVSLFLGVYLPAQYKLGYEKTKLFFVVLIMASPFIFAQSLKIENSFITNILDNINPVFLVTCSMIASFLILIVSSAISVRIYKKADLS